MRIQEMKESKKIEQQRLRNEREAAKTDFQRCNEAMVYTKLQEKPPIYETVEVPVYKTVATGFLGMGSKEIQDGARIEKNRIEPTLTTAERKEILEYCSKLPLKK